MVIKKYHFMFFVYYCYNQANSPSNLSNSSSILSSDASFFSSFFGWGGFFNGYFFLLPKMSYNTSLPTFFKASPILRPFVKSLISLPAIGATIEPNGTYFSIRDCINGVLSPKTFTIPSLAYPKPFFISLKKLENIIK